MKTKKKKFYICPLCKEEKQNCNKTEIITGKGSKMGCQDCFIKSIEKETIDKF